MIPQEVLNYFKGKRVLVTGDTGLIGRQVVDILAKAGSHILGASLDREGTNPAVHHCQGDLTDYTFCSLVTTDIDCVFHLAGSKGSVKATHERPADFYVPMLLFNTNVLHAAQVHNVKKLVYTSSIGAYAESKQPLCELLGMTDDPMDYFPGMAKRAAEIQILAYREQYGVHWSIVRPANVYGPGDKAGPDAMVVTALMSRLMQQENPLTVWGDGSAVRDFIFSRDAAEGIIMACYHETNLAPHGFVNLGSGKGYSIKELVETLKSFIAFDYKFDPTKPSGVPRRVMDTGAAEMNIHWKAGTPLVDGLKETWAWYHR